MMVNYTYLDDESADAVGPYIDAVKESVSSLHIEHLCPIGLSKQLQTCRKRERDGLLDGLILDLRLDQRVNSGERADYRATTLAQEIRTRATEGNIGEYPIVLWSTDEKLSKSYTRDDTSHDLFDLKAVKREMLEPVKAKRLALKLVSLVEGYQSIKQIRATSRRKLFRFLGFEEEPDFLDLRILSSIEGREGVLPAHEYARFIIRQLLDVAGPLIDENVLSARLGIDISKSKGFYSLVEKYFSQAAYNGPFHKGWPRWWSAKVDESWRNLPDYPGSLKGLNAEERVSFLRKASGLKTLTAALPSELSTSTNFWTVCQANLQPLDPKDGFLIDRQLPYSWQDKLYVSLDSLLDGTADENNIRIDPLEKGRFQRVKKRLTQNE